MTEEEKDARRERLKSLGILNEKVDTYEERRAKELDAVKAKLAKELAGYQTKATEAARTRTVAELAAKLATDEGLTDEEKEDFANKVANPSLIVVTPTDSDYGENAARVKELLSLVANPEQAEKQMEQEAFISNIVASAERRMKK